MGALIMTKGTKRLIALYNDEFHSWITFYRDAPVLQRFNRSGRNIDIWSDIVQQIRDTSTTNGHTDRPDNLTLLPKEHPKHSNLNRRWRVFLQSELGQANKNKLADAIYQALIDPNVYIAFDVRLGGVQDVILAPDVDDGNRIARITIITTGAMPATASVKGGDPPDLDC
jgi:hypothetical protein